MEKLKIQKTVHPDKKMDYNQWCKKYGVGRQYHENTNGSYSLHDYNFSCEKQPLLQSLLTRLINFLIPS